MGIEILLGNFEKRKNVSKTKGSSSIVQAGYIETDAKKVTDPEIGHQ